MKYICEEIIALPLEETIAKMDNAENMVHWQHGLIGYRQLNGEPGADGAQMELSYDFGKRKMTLVETIISNKFPHSFEATYITGGVENIQKNVFEKMPNGHTKWIQNSEFKFGSFGMKAMGFLMPGAFKKQSKKYMASFKAFAENGTSVKAN